MSSVEPTASPTVERLIGVYHANGTIVGELSYWMKSRLGGEHCSLCAITHGSVREKGEWKQCRAALPLEMTTVHLDGRSDALAAFTDGRTPCVVAETTGGFVMLVDAEGLAACNGSPTCLVDAIKVRAGDLGLSLG